MNKEQTDFMWYDKYVVGAALLSLILGFWFYWMLIVALVVSTVGLVISLTAWITTEQVNKEDNAHTKE